jgi:hypothetical protein
MKSTADFGVDENPKSWREGILKLSPRNGAPLYGLTSQMKSERTTSHEFTWWEEPVFMYTFVLGVGGLDATAGTDTVLLVAGGTRLKPGDMLQVASTKENIRVLTIVSDTSITVERARGDVAKPAGIAAAAAAGVRLIYIGSAYREGAPRSVGVSTSPTKQTNVTQIFRDPVEITRTAQQTTTYRTGDPFKNDRERAMHKHSLGIERAFWYGSKWETMESGQPLRTTGGVISFIDAGNDIDAGGTLSMAELMGLFPKLFAYGSKEKLAFGSLFVQSMLSQLVSKQGQYQWGPSEKEYGIDVRRFFTPAGTLVITEHPMFSATPGIANDLLVIDTANLRYRHLQDTTYLTDRQDKGVDGKADEYLTEAGLEVHHGLTHARVRNIDAISAEPVLPAAS